MYLNYQLFISSTTCRMFYKTPTQEWQNRSSWGSIRALHPMAREVRCICLYKTFIITILILGTSLILMLIYLLLSIHYGQDFAAYVLDRI